MKNTGSVLIAVIVGYCLARVPALPNLPSVIRKAEAAGDTILARVETLKPARSIVSEPQRPRTPSGLTPDTIERANRLVRIANDLGYQIHFTSLYRTYDQQADLYRNRDTNPYPVAPPGRSMHEVGRAFDIQVTPPSGVSQEAALAYLGEVWERLGGTWGGRFGDPIHFEN